ncbi:MAG: tetratricopeptide repeat protein [Elusimicrobiota bacterium]|jgi:tetratricopeptide (TPR) repeat protein|nr:tetratricopeptide repeat protein [Elusimicrobiota bacterium]
MKKFVFVFGFLFVAVNGYVADLDVSQIKNAQAVFDTGNYSQAIEIYETIISIDRIKNPYLYYNLSNAYFRNGELPKALLNLQRAKRLIPRNKDVRHNESYVEALLAQEQGYRFPKELFFTTYFSLNEITVAASLFLMLCFISVFLFIINRKPLFKKIAFYLGAIFFILCLLLIYKKLWQSRNNAVILEPATLRAISSADESNSNNLSLPAGSFVCFVLEKNALVLVKASVDGKSVEGWVSSLRIEKI